MCICMYLCVCLCICWRRKWQPPPVFLPGESHWKRSMVGYSPRGCEESDTTERLHFHFQGIHLPEATAVPHLSQVLFPDGEGRSLWKVVSSWLRFMDPGAIGPASLKPSSLDLSLPGCTLLCLRCGVWFPTLARVARAELHHSVSLQYVSAAMHWSSMLLSSSNREISGQF